MLLAERQERVRELLEGKQWLSVNELSALLEVSPSTVRRDLIELEQAGVLVRTRGGARLALPLPEEFSGAMRSQKHKEEKERIGRVAARLVENGGSIILDGGTTTLEVARVLEPVTPLRVITDSIEIAYELRDRKNVIVVVTGGIMRSRAYNLFGAIAEQTLSGMHAEICVMGASALSLEEGLTKHDIEALPVRKKFLEISRNLLVVCDSSKFNCTGLASVCPVTSINKLVTDPGIDPAFMKELEKHGVQVIIAD